MQALLGMLIGPPIVGGFTYILQRTGPLVPLYLWAFFFALQIFFMTIYPVFIAPLFNKFTALKEGSLRCRLFSCMHGVQCSSQWHGLFPHGMLVFCTTIQADQVHGNVHRMERARQ
jgi:hypothetical protein